MAGDGLPDDFAEAVRLSDSVADAANVVWEVLPDGEIEYERSDFVYKKRLSRHADHVLNICCNINAING